MGHVRGPFDIQDFEPPNEKERNLLMAWVDAVLCLLGSLTFTLGVIFDGLTPLLAYIGIISLMMGFLSMKRFEREKDMPDH